MRVLWIILGALSIIAGIMALANPLAATLTAERLAGWSFLFIGILEIFAVFQKSNWSGRIWAMLAGLAFALLGISLLANPLAGIMSLTLTVAVLFLVTGIFKIMMAFSLGRGNGFLLVLLSGALSVILAIMVFANFPASAVSILGVLLAIELISGGVSMIALSGTVAANEKRATV